MRKIFRSALLVALMLIGLLVVIGPGRVLRAANSYIGSLTADTNPTSDDLIETENDPSGTPTSRSVSLGNAIRKAHGLGNGMVKIASGVMGNASSSADYQAYMPQATQAEMEAGSVTALRAMTPLGVHQAIAAQAGTGGMVYPPAGIPNSTSSSWGSSYAIDTDLATVSGSDDTIPSAKAVKAYADTKQAADADIPTVSASQAEMEAGTETALRSMSPQRVAQAIAALGGSGSGTDTNGWDYTARSTAPDPPVIGKVYRANNEAGGWDPLNYAGTTDYFVLYTGSAYVGIVDINGNLLINGLPAKYDLDANLVGPDAGDVFFVKIQRATTAASLGCRVSGGTSIAATIEECDSAYANCSSILGATLTCGTSATAASLSDTAWAAGSVLKFTMGTETGTVPTVHFYGTGTQTW